MNTDETAWMQRPRGYKKIMFNSDEHEIFLLINVKMPTIVGSLTFSEQGK